MISIAKPLQAAECRLYRRTLARLGLTALALALTIAAVLGLIAACLVLTTAEALAQGALLQAPTPKVDTEFPDPAPKAPDIGRLVDIEVASTSTRYAVDPSSILTSEGIFARFTMVITSTSGVRNVSFEAIRCDKPERKLLAIGQPDGGWHKVRDPKWVEIGTPGANIPGLKPLYLALCTGGGLVTDVRQGLADMNRPGVRQRGGTPGV